MKKIQYKGATYVEAAGGGTRGVPPKFKSPFARLMKILHEGKLISSGFDFESPDDAKAFAKLVAPYVSTKVYKSTVVAKPKRDS